MCQLVVRKQREIVNKSDSVLPEEGRKLAYLPGCHVSFTVCQSWSRVYRTAVSFHLGTNILFHDDKGQMLVDVDGFFLSSLKSV